jgi:hypothetical protein
MRPLKTEESKESIDEDDDDELPPADKTATNK